jgi:hypothetical protein
MLGLAYQPIFLKTGVFVECYLHSALSRTRDLSRVLLVIVCLFLRPTNGRVRSQPNSRRLASRRFRGINDNSLRATPHLFHVCL